MDKSNSDKGERDYKCFRHQFEPTNRRCRLCDAKREAKGNIEYARRIFIKGGEK